jgi:hypothetical protein
MGIGYEEDWVCTHPGKMKTAGHGGVFDFLRARCRASGQHAVLTGVSHINI